MRSVVAILAAIAVMIVTFGARADFADGAQAYDGGDYETAFEEWIGLARGGDVLTREAGQMYARLQKILAEVGKSNEGPRER